MTELLYTESETDISAELHQPALLAYMRVLGEEYPMIISVPRVLAEIIYSEDEPVTAAIRLRPAVDGCDEMTGLAHSNTIEETAKLRHCLDDVPSARSGITSDIDIAIQEKHDESVEEVVSRSEDAAEQPSYKFEDFDELVQQMDQVALFCA